MCGCATGRWRRCPRPSIAPSACACWSATGGDSRRTSDTSEESIRRTARRALEVAAASNIASTQRVVLSDVEPHVATWASTYEIDPWSIPIEQKIEHLLAATEPMRGDARIHQVSGEISCYRQEKIFASTVGSYIEQTTTEMGGGIEAVAIDGGEFQRRTYPNPFGGDFQAAGWEFIERLDLPRKALADPRRSAGAAGRAESAGRTLRSHRRLGAARAAGPRVVRPSDRARSGHGAGDLAGRRLVPAAVDARQLPLRLGARQHRRRRHDPRLDRLVRLRRRRRSRAALPSHRERDVRRLPHRPRHRAGHRPQVERHGARGDARRASRSSA